jgi:hypothetical protein
VFESLWTDGTAEQVADRGFLGPSTRFEQVFESVGVGR